jgi:glycosyltransferase involved in cell wall biosynthesis
MEKTRINISVSVIMPAYNAEPWINEAIDSILAQTFPVLEILAVDDGSTDNTAEIIHSYPEPVKYIYQEHRGVSAARNTAIRAAKGDFVAFIDADDYWHPRKIELQVNLLAEKKLEWASCETQAFDSTTREYIDGLFAPMRDGDILQPLLLNDFIGSATPIVRRTVFERAGYFNEEYDARIGEDWDMWLRIASEYPLGVVREKLAFHRLHSTSTMSTTSIADRTRSLVGVVERALKRNPEELDGIAKQALANIYHGAGVRLMKQDEYKDARQYFLKELRYRPFNLETWVYILLSIAGPGISKALISIKRLLFK